MNLFEERSLDTPPAAAPPPAAPESPQAALRPFHPLLFAAFPTLALLAHNRHEAQVMWAMTPLLLSVVATGALWGLLALIMRDTSKSALGASLAVVFFFSFGHVTTQLERWSVASPGAYHTAILLGDGAVLLIVIALLSRRHDRRPVVMTRFANVASVVLVLMPVVNLIRFEVTAWRAGAVAVGAIPPTGSDGASAAAFTERPDVYLIVPDAHARADVMRDLYFYDMEPFLAELESLGFTIARQSTSNYGLTPKSLASMLNYRYLEEYDELPARSFRPFEELIRGSTLVAALKEAGYKTVAFPTGESYSEMQHFDRYVKNPAGGSAFHRLYVELTPIALVLANNYRWNAYISQRDRLVETLQRLPDVASDPAPTFTFVHLSLPHPPFRFDESGRDVFALYRDLADNGKSGRPEKDQLRYLEAYRGQVAYTDQLLLKAIRGILRESDRPPIIILLSDHGPRLNMDWDVPEQTDVREALGNLTAIFLPEGSDAIYPTITPINVIRVLLNEGLGAQLPLLPDRGFLSVNHDGWYRLLEVTDRLHQEEGSHRQPSMADSISPHPSTEAALDNEREGN